MVWLVVGALALAALVGIALAIGAVLPRGHSVSRMAHFNRSQREVWKVVADFGEQVSWRSDLSRVERLPNRSGLEVWLETDRRGQSLTYETIESVPPRRLVRRIAGEDLGFGGSWAFDITEVGEVTAVTVTEHSEVYNPLFRFISRVITGQTAAIDAYLRALGEKLGVDVNITSV